MRNIFVIFVFSLLIPISNTYGQELFQNIRGTVTDRESMTPLPGATVIVEGSDPLIGTT